MSAPLELRNSATGKIFPALGPVIIGVMFAFGALRGLVSGADGGWVLVIALVAAGCLGLGYVIARGAFDTSVKVTLDSHGFRDARAGDVLVPWKMVKSVHLTSGKGSAMLNFELTGEPPGAIKYGEKRSGQRTKSQLLGFLSSNANALNLVLPFGRNIVHMEISSLDVRGQDMVEAVQKFAPHVVVRR